MTLQQLEYVIALDNHRQFVKAAESCFVTQPTLTMQIKKLEDEVGIQIFDRSKKPLEATRQGEQFIVKARQIMREVNQLKEFVATEKDSLTGEFRVGIIPTLAPYLLPRFLPGFIKENPDTHLNIQELKTTDIISGLKNDTIDIGILVTPLNERSLREVILFNEPFLLYVPEYHALAKNKEIDASELDTGDILLLQEGHCFRDQIMNICNKRIPKSDRHFNYESGSIEALIEMVNRNMGYTLVPELSMANRINDPHIRHFSEPVPAREVSIVVHKSFAKELLIDKFRKAILSEIPDSFIKNEHYIRVKWR